MMRKNRKGSSSVWEGGTSLKKLASTMSGQAQSSAAHGGGHAHQTPAQTRRSRSQMQGGVSFGHDRSQGGAGVLPSLSKWVPKSTCFLLSLSSHVLSSLIFLSPLSSLLSSLSSSTNHENAPQLINRHRFTPMMQPTMPYCLCNDWPQPVMVSGGVPASR